jgi:hypothetical protein
MEALMLPNRPRRTEKLFLAAEPELRAAIEREAVRRDTSMSSTIRALIRTALASQSTGMQAVAR